MEDKLVFDEINERDMREAPDVVTALDETIPSPARIQMAETVELPEIQTMTGYIRRHYEDEILAALTRKIQCGELGVQCGGKLLRETSHTASGNDGKENLSKAPVVIPSDGGAPEEAAHRRRNAPLVSITPLAGKIALMGFRRVGLYFVEADLVIEMEAEIRCGVPQSSQRVTQRYRADMCISMESGIEVEYGNFRIHRYEEDRDGIRLDEYLIPVFHWEDIEKEAEDIIFRIAPEALHDPTYLRPAVLAERLGLKIIGLPLYRRDRTASILFFDAGEVLVCQDVQQPQLPPVHVRVEADTIVLNTTANSTAIVRSCTSAFTMSNTGCFSSCSSCTTATSWKSSGGSAWTFRNRSAARWNGWSGRGMWGASAFSCRKRTFANGCMRNWTVKTRQAGIWGIGCRPSVARWQRSTACVTTRCATG